MWMCIFSFTFFIMDKNQKLVTEEYFGHVVKGCNKLYVLVFPCCVKFNYSNAVLLLVTLQINSPLQYNRDAFLLCGDKSSIKDKTSDVEQTNNGSFKSHTSN